MEPRSAVTRSPESANPGRGETPLPVEPLVRYPRDILDWLNSNSGAVTAVATVAGVVVAAAYSIFAVLQWRATKTQADITRRIFEAGHRPWITVRAEEPVVIGVTERLSFALVFHVHGTVPGTVTDFDVKGVVIGGSGSEYHVPRSKPLRTPVGRSLAPGESEKIGVDFGGGGPSPDESFSFHTMAPHQVAFRLRGRIEYQGVAQQTYTTDFDCERRKGRWTEQRCSMT